MLLRGNCALGERLFVTAYQMRPSTDYNRKLSHPSYRDFTSLRDSHWPPPKFPKHQSLFNGWVAVGLYWPQHSNPGKYVWVHTWVWQTAFNVLSQRKILGLPLYAPFLFSSPNITTVFLHLNFSFPTMLLLSSLPAIPMEKCLGQITGPVLESESLCGVTLSCIICSTAISTICHCNDSVPHLWVWRAVKIQVIRTLLSPKSTWTWEKDNRSFAQKEGRRFREGGTASRNFNRVQL